MIDNSNEVSCFDFKNSMEIIEKIPLALKLLSGLKRTSDLFINQRCYNAFIYIGRAIACGDQIIDGSEFNQFNLARFLGDVLIYLYQINDDLDFKNEYNDLENAPNALDLNERRVYIFAISLYIISLNSIKSISFSIKISASLGLDAHLLFLSDKKFIEKNLYSRMPIWQGEVDILEYLVINTCSLSAICDDYKKKWIDLNAVDVLLNIKNIKKSIELDACCAIANIADDNQIESLNKVVVDKLIAQINLAALDLKTNKFNGINELTTPLLVLLQCLYKISVNDSIKIEIYFAKNLKKSLKNLLKLGNETEIKYSLRLLAQFTFNKEISTDLMNDQEMKDILSQVSNKFSSINQAENDSSIINICMHINWNLEKAINPSDFFLSEKNQHIMISYNNDSIDTCLKIKEKLESFGHKVWMNINNTNDWNLDSIAKSIEISYCVLVCVNEKYRQSLSCQAEAQYASRINKPIIPVIIQDGYENLKGWLGFIIKDKVSINFNKYEFDESMSKLRTQIDSLLMKSKPSKDPIIKIHENKSKINCCLFKNKSESTNLKNQLDSKEALHWTEQDVNDWFVENRINKSLLESISPCNGVVLYQLNEMKNEAPEFFYQAIKTDVSSLATFAFHLKNLFQSPQLKI